ncbi:hypothetical protein EDD11_009565 [Mortierella claussenii]|nr:hypothetical protein EDD11_009565 [Mortierella claussenii]
MGDTPTQWVDTVDGSSVITPLDGEAGLIDVQKRMRLLEEQQRQSEGDKFTQALNTAGNGAFVAGTNILVAKDLAETAVKKVLGDKENPILNNMIQLADKLVDVGKSVPFIAPAFVILKIIIDIEQKAREADEKCQDLMERINFMVSHVLVLEQIEVIETLKTVLQRVQETLKEAAALIEAYRKQGKIVRRLKMSNTQNFEAMASRITSCSSDLMMSLQIQQTGDLSVLKRAVPRDLAAETFIKEHGGQEAINNDPELVKAFADKMHLAMSDQVMTQMQSNMQEVMAQNQQQIEDLIRASSSNNIAVTIKAIATQQREWEAERKLTCVQCNKEYNVSANGPQACVFHSAVGNYDRYHCCNKTSPCQTGYHQPEHHSKYPYSNFYPWSYGILGHSDTVDYWVKVVELDLEEEEESAQLARVGQLIRWRTWGELVTTPLMLINIGHVQDDLLHYMEILDVAAVEEERRRVIKSGNTRIFKNAAENETSAYSMGEWILDQETQQITGIKLTVKVKSNKAPTICIVPMDPKELKMPSESVVQYLSRGEWQMFKPDRPYEFPETIQLGPRLRETRLREPRTFKTKAPADYPIVLLPTSEMVANNSPRTARRDVDRFLGHWRALNRAPLSSQNQVIFLSAKAEYRLVGETEYKPVNDFGLRQDIKFPLSVAPSQVIDIPFEFTVNKPETVRKDTMRAVSINFANLTIQRPLRARITLTDIEGNNISLVQEYVHPVRGIESRTEEDIGYFFVDDLDFCLRTIVRIKTSNDPSTHFIRVQGGLMMAEKVTEMDLHRIAYKAQKTGVSQVDMKLGVSNMGLDWKIWALVDLNCRRVYGFKVLLYPGSSTPIKIAATLGYAACPYYGGDDLETRPIRYAEETKIVPEVVHCDIVAIVEDDALDDDVPQAVVQAPNPAPAALTSTSVPSPAEAPAHVPPAIDAVPTPPPVVPSKAITAASVVPSSQPPASAIPQEATSAMQIEPVTSIRTADPRVSSASVPLSAGPEFSSSAILAVAPAATSVKAVSSSVLDTLLAKIAALEARLEASERHDALVSKVLALEQKLEENGQALSTVAAALPSMPAAAGQPQSADRVSVLERRLESMDQKLDAMNINLRLLDGNASRMAMSLDKIANVLTQ